MFCYRCGKGAVSSCRKCFRSICNDHLAAFDAGSGWLCDECQSVVAGVDAQWYAKKKLLDEKSRRSCHICGANVTEEGTDYRRCRVCGGNFCSQHGSVMREHQVFKTYFWIRCQHHPPKKSLWRILDFSFEPADWIIDDVDNDFHI